LGDADDQVEDEQEAREERQTLGDAVAEVLGGDRPCIERIGRERSKDEQKDWPF